MPVIGQAHRGMRKKKKITVFHNHKYFLSYFFPLSSPYIFLHVFTEKRIWNKMREMLEQVPKVRLRVN